MANAVISGIYTTPIKGCVMQPHFDTTFVRASSFAEDRRYMIVAWRPDKEIWDFVTQRSFAGKGIARPQLGGIVARVSGNRLFLQRYYPLSDGLKFTSAAPLLGSADLVTPLLAHAPSFVEEPFFEAQLWDDIQTVTEVSQEASAFFTSVLTQEDDDIGPFKLVTRAGGTEEMTRYDVFTESCADKYPVHLVTVPSLKLLAERSGLDLNETRARFRPNLVLNGDFEPFAEDTWEVVHIDGKTFRVTGKTKRCGFVNIGLDGETDKQHNLLGELAKERRAQGHGGSPTFGLHLATDENQELRFGQEAHCS